MKPFFFFLLLGFAGWALWGCPTKRYIPDPKNPQPQVEEQKKENQSDYYYDALQVLEGRAPHVGPRIEFIRMLAFTNSLPGPNSDVAKTF